ALGRNPLDAGDHVLNAIAPVHADEPFIYWTKNQLRLAAPAVRIDVRIFFLRHQEARGLQRRHDIVRHFAGVLAGERTEAVDKDRALIQRGDERDAVLVAQLLVLGAASGRDVDQPRAFFLADGVPRDHAVGRGRSRI